MLDQLLQSLGYVLINKSPILCYMEKGEGTLNRKS